MSWGHAVAEDLIHWKEWTVAIPEADGVAIFSGSAVVDSENTSGFAKAGSGVTPYVAIYTGDSSTQQDQNLAYSIDGGNSWIKYENNPVL